MQTMVDRRDKFTYTDPRQIKTGERPSQAKARRALSELIEREGLDAAKVLALVREHVGELRHEADR
jgi:hypothetical protein